MIEDPERCYAAVRSRDPRFDGWFVLAVTSTGIYCRPSCPAMTPKRANARFYPSAAAAQGAGFRSCKRCRPDATPGSPEWSTRADVAARAVRLIADGTVDREGVHGLAARLGYSSRQLQRVLHAELGAGALALARAQRAQTARLLCETTDLALAEVAFAAGFGSVRQFNDTVAEVYDLTPGELRRRARSSRPAVPRGRSGLLSVRLAHRTPLAAAELVDFLARRAVAGAEAAITDDTGRVIGLAKALRLPHAPGTVELVPDDGHVRATLRLGDTRDLAAAVARCRRLLDLDADPVAVDAHLGADPLLAPLVAARPGLRVPGATDAFEVAVRAVIGQQISVRGAVTILGRLTAAVGDPLPDPVGPLTHTFPAPEALAGLDPARIDAPRARATALVSLAAAVADGELDLGPGADRAEARAALARRRGIGPWTVEDIALRGLADPDALPATDLGVRRSIAALTGTDPTPARVAELASRWRPWRAYATLHLWSHTS